MTTQPTDIQQRIIDDATTHGAYFEGDDTTQDRVVFTAAQLESFVQSMLNRWNQATKGEPNMIRITRYNDEGKVEGSAVLGDHDRIATTDKLQSFWQLEEAADIRNVPIPVYKIGALYVTSSQGLAASMFKGGSLNIEAAAKFLHEYAQAHGRTLFMDSDGARVLRNTPLKPVETDPRDI